MKAIEIRNKTIRVRSERKQKEKQSRSHIETNMEWVYKMIDNAATNGHFSVSFPIEEISSKAQDELERNGFKIDITHNGFTGTVIRIYWLNIFKK